MGPMVRRPRLASWPRLLSLAAAVSVLAATGAGDPAAARAAGPIARPDLTLTVGGGIVPGHVGRTSLALTATYDATLRIDYGTRAVSVDSTATITNTSTASIDRVELNTAVARLGAMHLTAVTVDGHTVSASVPDQTILVPLGGILPVGATTAVRVRYTATLRSSLRLPTGCSPRSTASSTRTAGCRGSRRRRPSIARTTATRSSRRSARSSVTP